MEGCRGLADVGMFQIGRCTILSIHEEGLLPHAHDTTHLCCAIVRPTKVVIMTSNAEYGERTSGSEVAKAYADSIKGKTSMITLRTCLLPSAITNSTI